MILILYHWRQVLAFIKKRNILILIYQILITNLLKNIKINQNKITWKQCQHFYLWVPSTQWNIADVMWLDDIFSSLENVMAALSYLNIHVSTAIMYTASATNASCITMRVNAHFLHLAIWTALSLNFFNQIPDTYSKFN